MYISEDWKIILKWAGMAVVIVIACVMLYLGFQDEPNVNMNNYDIVPVEESVPN